MGIAYEEAQKNFFDFQEMAGVPT